MLAPAPRSRIKWHALIGATRTTNIHKVNIYQARVHIALTEDITCVISYVLFAVLINKKASFFL